MIIGRESPKLTGDSLTDARKLNSWNREFTENYNLESSQMQKQIAALQQENTGLKQQVIDDNAGLQEQITALSETVSAHGEALEALTPLSELFTEEWKTKVQTCINKLYARAFPTQDQPFDDE